MEEIDLSGRKDPIYMKEEFINKVGELYERHKNFNEVTKILSEEYNQPIDRGTISDIYKKNLSKKIIKEDSNFFDKSYKRMQKQLKDAWDMLEDIIQDYKTVRKVIRESDLDEYSKALKMLSRVNDVIRIIQEVRKQFEFIDKSLKDVQNFQQNNTNINIIQFKKETKNILNSLSKNEIRELFESTENKQLKMLAEKLK